MVNIEIKIQRKKEKKMKHKWSGMENRQSSHVIVYFSMNLISRQF